jgi:hypothetical protein
MGLKEIRNGWSSGQDSRAHLPRHELPSEYLHTVERPAEPAVPAWNEPGYPDPDLHHADLPEGSRYWQGYSKQAKPVPPGEERPLSPGLVERVTRKFWSRSSAASQDPNRNWRQREQERISRKHWLIWPG